MEDDTYYMGLAIKEAEKASLIDEVPVGAVIVDADGTVISRAHNQREKTSDPTSHAEIVAIRKACRKRGSWRLPDCTIYVTIEPCPMCSGCLLWTRIKRIVYGAKDPKGGSLGSSFNLFQVNGINHHPEIDGGIMEGECSSIMKGYFKGKRK